MTTKAKLKKASVEKTRERILRAAFSEFALRGYSGTRMESIAQRAKTNKAMIHYYFGNKKDLYRTLLELVFSFNELEENLDRELAQWELTVDQQLYIILFVITGIHLDRHLPEKRDMYRLMAWETAEGQTGIRLLAKDFFVPRLQKLAQLINLGIQQGIFAPVHPWLFIYSIISRVMFYVMQQDLFKDTAIYHQLYKEVNRETFFNFLCNSVFRELSPPEKPLPVPQIPSEIMQRLEKLVEQLRNNHLSFARA